MTGIPEILGSSALWALSRIVELGAHRVAAFDNSDSWLFLTGFGAACAVSIAIGARAALSPAATPEPSPARARGSTATAAAPRGKTPLSPYRTLSTLMPDTEAREARIAELVDANGMTRLEAIARLVETLSASPDTSQASTPRLAGPAPLPSPDEALGEHHGDADPFVTPTSRTPATAAVFDPPMPPFSPEKAEAEISARIPDGSVRQRLIEDRMSDGSARSRHEAILQILGMSIPSVALDRHFRALMNGDPGSASPDAVGFMQPSLTRSK